MQDLSDLIALAVARELSVKVSSSIADKLPPRGRRDDMPPADSSWTRGGSTSVRGPVRSPHVAKLHAASVPIA